MFTSSSTVSGVPFLMSSTTQVFMWLARRTRLNELSAAFAAETCVNMSGQYASFSSIFNPFYLPFDSAKPVHKTLKFFGTSRPSLFILRWIGNFCFRANLIFIGFFFFHAEPRLYPVWVLILYSVGVYVNFLAEAKYLCGKLLFAAADCSVLLDECLSTLKEGFPEGVLFCSPLSFRLFFRDKPL